MFWSIILYLFQDKISGHLRVKFTFWIIFAIGWFTWTNCRFRTISPKTRTLQLSNDLCHSLFQYLLFYYTGCFRQYRYNGQFREGKTCFGKLFVPRKMLPKRIFTANWFFTVIFFKLFTTSLDFKVNILPTQQIPWSSPPNFRAVTLKFHQSNF